MHKALRILAWRTAWRDVKHPVRGQYVFGSLLLKDPLLKEQGKRKDFNLYFEARFLFDGQASFKYARKNLTGGIYGRGKKRLPGGH
ncbi:MAG: hypothetical protein JRJ15_10275 [Deltaproteobacteria bacterium]|nr:hypothetical protein [Deltaproteobacteria bacterium]